MDVNHITLKIFDLLALANIAAARRMSACFGPIAQDGLGGFMEAVCGLTCHFFDRPYLDCFGHITGDGRRQLVLQRQNTKEKQGRRNKVDVQKMRSQMIEVGDNIWIRRMGDQQTARPLPLGQERRLEVVNHAGHYVTAAGRSIPIRMSGVVRNVKL